MRRRSRSRDGFGEFVAGSRVGRSRPSSMFARAKPIISRPISATWSTKGRLRAMNSAISDEVGRGLLVDDDADFDSLFELAEVEDSADGVVERAVLIARRSRGARARRRRSGCRPSCSGCRPRPSGWRSRDRRSGARWRARGRPASGRTVAAEPEQLDEAVPRRASVRRR